MNARIVLLVLALAAIPALSAAPPDRCIMVIGAHSDDVEQIAGATLPKYVALGYRAVYVVLENNLAGNSIRPGVQETDALEVIQHRTENARNAAAFYKADPVFLNLHETHLWFGRKEAYTGSKLWSLFLPPGTADITCATRRPQVIEEIAELFLHYNPELAVTHCLGQGNIEHHSAADLVYRAWHQARSRGARLGQLWFQAGDTYGIISEPSFSRFFEPVKVSVDVTDYVDTMFKASEFHARNDYEKRKRIALQGQGFDPQKRQPKYYEHFFVVAGENEKRQESEGQEAQAPAPEPILKPRPGKQPCVMAVGAHTDDIELSCGGTFSKLIEQGWKGIYVGSTNNTAGCQLNVYQPARPGGYLAIQPFQGSFPSDALETIQIRQEEGRRAAAILNAEAVFLNFHETWCWIGRKSAYMDDEAWGPYDAPGRGMITYASRLREGVDLVVNLLKKYEPDIVLSAHVVGETNPEHGQTADLIYRAFKRAMQQKVRVGQLWLSVGRRTQFLDRVRIKPDISIDVTGSIEHDWKALGEHVSQNGGRFASRKREERQRYYDYYVIVLDNTGKSQ
jgi:LmbE family N-acetylglucosaminyl deacetylase